MSAIENFGKRLLEKFETAKTNRRIYEQEWLHALRQYRGVYDPDIAARIEANRSHAYVRLTRVKVKTMDARLMDMMFPGGGNVNWSLKLAPDPNGVSMAIKLPGEPLQGAHTSDQADAQGRTDAEQRLDAMSAQMREQLTDTNYKRVCRRVIHDGNLYGTGIMKGPLVESASDGRWVFDSASGAHLYVSARSMRPYLQHVRLWDVYPDLSSRSLDDAEFIFESHEMLRKDLRDLASRTGFNAAVIERYIRDHPEGDLEPRNVDVEIREIERSATAPRNSSARFQVLEYWGYADGRELLGCGCDLPEPLREAAESSEFEAKVWVLGNQVIKAVLNPFDTARRPYHFYYYERDESSIFGVGIASILRDTERVFNAAVRAAIDNAAISAGPILEVNQSLLAPGENAQDIAPFRVFVRKGTSNEAGFPAIRSYTVTNNTAALLNLAAVFKNLGDEASAIPAYVHGDPANGVARTVGGLSMLMGAANITLKDVGAHYDAGITRPVIRALYDWNMQFSPRTEIKGEYRITTRGVASLVAKEVRAQQLEQLAARTANPLDAIYYDREELNREILRANGLDPAILLRTKEEIAAQMKFNGMQLSPDEIQAQIELAKLSARAQAQHDKLVSKQHVEGAKLALEEQKLELQREEDSIKARKAALDTALAERDKTLARAEQWREANLEWDWHYGE